MIHGTMRYYIEADYPAIVYIRKRPAPSSRAADFYAWLRREPGRTTTEICRRFGYSGTYQLDNLLMECETCGLLLFEGELPPDGAGRPEVALFAMEGG